MTISRAAVPACGAPDDGSAGCGVRDKGDDLRAAEAAQRRTIPTINEADR
jgi:hypothetical protein